MLLILVNTILSGFIMWCAICVTNRMTKYTRVSIRFAYIALGTVAAGSLLYPFWFEEAPHTGQTILLLAVASLFYGDKRKGAIA